MRRIIATLIATLAAMCVALTLTPALAHAAPIPPCTHEDGSGQDLCRWDASAQGNWGGDSFVVRRTTQGVTFVYDNGDTYAEANVPTRHALHVLHMGKRAPWCAEDFAPSATQRVCRTPDSGGVVVTMRAGRWYVSVWPGGHVVERRHA